MGISLASVNADRRRSKEKQDRLIGARRSLDEVQSQELSRCYLAVEGRPWQKWAILHVAGQGMLPRGQKVDPEEGSWAWGILPGSHPTSEGCVGGMGGEQ